jgi:hypothetical protein
VLYGFSNGFQKERHGSRQAPAWLIFDVRPRKHQEQFRQMRTRFFIYSEKEEMCSALIQRGETGGGGADAHVHGERAFAGSGALLPRRKPIKS